MSQISKIKAHLNIYGTITSWEAIELFRCTRLAEYIRQLREGGLDIQSNWRENNGKRFVEYSIVRDKQLNLF